MKKLQIYIKFFFYSKFYLALIINFIHVQIIV
jgi:hypothetical protein